jgi:hypothetical protein
MTVYVQRDASGGIVGVYAVPQPGYAAEALADDDPAVVAYLNRPPVPQVVSSMQAKVALSRAGLLTNVENWVNAQSAETQLIWNTATTFSRDSQLLNTAAGALGLSSAQVDQLFVTAASINP